MALTTQEIIDVLRERGIEPTEEIEAADIPGIGQVVESETIYSTSIAEVESDDEGSDTGLVLDDDRLREWWNEIEHIIGAGQQPRPRPEPPEPLCASYCP